MKYFRIIEDGLDFKTLDLELFDFIEDFPDHVTVPERASFDQNNLSLKGFWKTPNTTLIESYDTVDGQVPDITIWSYRCLLLSPKAHRFLQDLLSPAGEFLPVRIEGSTWYLFNPQVFYPDESLSVERFEEGVFEGFLKELSFAEVEDFTAPLFKTSPNNNSYLYCDERLRDAVSSFGLAGIQFTTELVESWE